MTDDRDSAGADGRPRVAGTDGTAPGSDVPFVAVGAGVGVGHLLRPQRRDAAAVGAAALPVVAAPRRRPPAQGRAGAARQASLSVRFFAAPLVRRVPLVRRTAIVFVFGREPRTAIGRFCFELAMLSVQLEGRSKTEQTSLIIGTRNKNCHWSLGPRDGDQRRVHLVRRTGIVSVLGRRTRTVIGRLCVHLVRRIGIVLMFGR